MGGSRRRRSVRVAGQGGRQDVGRHQGGSDRRRLVRAEGFGVGPSPDRGRRGRGLRPDWRLPARRGPFAGHAGRASRIHDSGGATGSLHPGQAMTEQSRRATLLAVTAMVVAGACWGLAAVMAKTAFDRGVPPVRMAEARVVVALAVLTGILAWRRRDVLRPPPGTIPILIAFGLPAAWPTPTFANANTRLGVGERHSH